MKPRIKKKSTYSILLMRDDSGVARFRMLGIWIKLACWLFVFLAVGTAAGGWGSWYFWNKFTTLQADYSMLQQEAAEYRPRLEQLNNIEKLRRAAPQLVNGEANATVPGDGDEGLVVSENSNGNATGGVSATVNATAAVDKPQEAAIPPLIQPEGPQPARIANPNLRSLGSNKFQLSFDLVNQSQAAISGKINLALVTSKGIVDLPTLDEELRSFRIMNFKKINTTFDLPAEASRDTVHSVQVSVVPDRDSAYIERIPLP